VFTGGNFPVNFVSACTLCEDKDLHRADPPSEFFLVLLLRTSTCVDCHSALVGYCQQSSTSITFDNYSSNNYYYTTHRRAVWCLHTFLRTIHNNNIA
jgi:hypothetical protein